MEVALGLKAHSGWAALVAVGSERNAPVVSMRVRLALVEPGDEEWAKQPYHAAEGLEPEDANAVVKRGIDSARRIAARELKIALKELASAKHTVVACGVLMGNPMPAFSVADILAVHFRMHQAEGDLFRDVLLRAAQAAKLRVVAVPEKTLATRVSDVCGTSAAKLTQEISARAKPLGAPWGKDQKDAALAAWIALRTANA